MRRRLVILSLVSFLATLLGERSRVLADAAPAALPPQVRFVGRWDRRQADRAITVNGGSHILAQFDGTGVTARFDVSQNKAPFPTLAWRVDAADWQEAEVAESVNLARDLPSGAHVLTLMARGLDEHQSRWSPPLVASLTFLGLDVSGAGGGAGKLLDPPAAWDRPTLKIEFLGDSITEGVLVHGNELGEGKQTWPWKTDGRLAFVCQTAQRLGAQWRQVGFGAQGLTHGGSGGTPPAGDAFNFFWKECPRDDWQADLVVINQGTNDGRATPEKFRPLYKSFLETIRKAYPAAKIAAMRPFNGAHAADIQAEVQARVEGGDASVFYVDTTGWLEKGDFTDGLHPNVAGSTKAADRLAAALSERALTERLRP